MFRLQSSVKCCSEFQWVFLSKYLPIVWWVFLSIFTYCTVGFIWRGLILTFIHSFFCIATLITQSFMYLKTCNFYKNITAHYWILILLHNKYTLHISIPLAFFLMFHKEVMSYMFWFVVMGLTVCFTYQLETESYTQVLSLYQLETESYTQVLSLSDTWWCLTWQLSHLPNCYLCIS